MRPVYIAGCLGMLHPAAGSRGVLICSSLGDETLNMHRPLAFLAEQFALAGSPTLRLQYYGTGDSGGEDGEPGRFQAWLAGIVAGVRWLRENCGVGPVTLVGARIGATLAARAACDIEDIEGLICICPAPNGRRFLRELILRARTIAEIWQVPDRVEEAGWFEAHGLRLDPPTRDTLERLDAGKLPRCPAMRALVLDQPDSAAGSLMAQRLQQLGATVSAETVHGLEAMLRDPYENALPHDAFDRAIAWHADAASAGTAVRQSDQNRLIRLASVSRDTPAAGSAVLLLEYGQETPVGFGQGGRLFGILTTPAHPRDNAPPVLIANTAANPRYGNSRGFVTLSRWLAANGLASLRIDGTGIGDSALDTGERGQPYSAQGDLDVTAAIDELSRRFDSPVLLLGLCSGAFHALRSAYDDHRVAGLMLVNLQKFAWQDGDSLSVVQQTNFRTARFYLQTLLKPRAWERLMHGEIDVGGIARGLAARLLRRMAASTDQFLALLHRNETHVKRVRRRVHTLQQRKVPILFVLSGNDPGLAELADYFGAQGRMFRRQANVMFRLLDGADHSFSHHWARENLFGMIALFLRQRCSLVIKAAETSVPPPPARLMPPHVSRVRVASVN